MSQTTTFYMTAEDLADMRKNYFLPLKHVSDEKLLDILGNEVHLVNLAREWGWDETEVRDDSAYLLETAGVDLYGSC